MRELQRQEGLAAWALQFTILSAARTSEVLLAQWQEFDLEKGVWTVPGVRMKSRREHRVPLSKPALALLQTRHDATAGKGFVFPGERPRKPLSNMAIRRKAGRAVVRSIVNDGRNAGQRPTMICASLTSSVSRLRVTGTAAACAASSRHGPTGTPSK